MEHVSCELKIVVSNENASAFQNLKGYQKGYNKFVPHRCLLYIPPSSMRVGRKEAETHFLLPKILPLICHQGGYVFMGIS